MLFAPCLCLYLSAMLDLFRPPSPFILRARGVSFSPLSLFAASEPGVWLDPSDLTTLFQDAAGTTPVTAAGQSVGRVLDKSGRGFHATQATAAARPTYQVDSNGRGYLSFDGVDDWLVTPTITSGIDKVQVFAGVRKLSDAASGMLVEHSPTYVSNAGSWHIAALGNTTTQKYSTISRGNAAANAGHTSTATDGNAPDTAVITALHDISGDSSIIRRNGVAYAAGVADKGTGNFLAYPLYIGRRGGTTLPFNGRIYGLIVRFGANLTADQITQTETWINSKTGAF